MNTLHSDLKQGVVTPLKVPFSRRDLAVHYFPGRTVDSSVRRLHRWLADDPELVAALRAEGYYDKQHYFTRRQLAVFQYFFGP